MNSRKLRNRKSKKSILLVSLAAFLILMIGGTLAYIFAQSDDVNNTFIPGEVTTTVDEEFDGKVKENVSIRNTGNVEAYIRAAVVVTWQDEKGNVHSTVPVAGTDYNISYNLNNDNGWVKSSDGFYYWTEPVKSEDEAQDNCNTGILITSCAPIQDKAPEGYALSVEIIASGIQADGVVEINGVEVPAVVNAWSSGVSELDGTTLVIRTESITD